MKIFQSVLARVALFIAVFGSLATASIKVGQRFSPVYSAQAFINGEIVSVRASIPGKLTLQGEETQLGHRIEKGAQIGAIKSTVENSRVSTLVVEKQQLEADLQNAQQQYSGVDAQIRDRTALMNFFGQQTTTQRSLQTNYARQQIEQYEAEVARAKAVEGVARADAQRFSMLAERGAVSRTEADNQVARAQQAAAATAEVQEKASQARLSLEATEAGLQLEGTRTLDYPSTQVYELGVALVDLIQQEKTLARQIKTLRSQLFTTTQEMNAQQRTSVTAPIEGVIWSIDSQPGEVVEANDSILQLVNCQNLWIEAFVNEAQIDQIKVGQRAEVSLEHSDDIRWEGKVETVRGGIGRAEVGEYIAKLPPEISLRQLPIRVASVTLKLDWQGRQNPGYFCLAGRNVNVRFVESVQ